MNNPRMKKKLHTTAHHLKLIALEGQREYDTFWWERSEENHMQRRNTQNGMGFASATTEKKKKWNKI